MTPDYEACRAATDTLNGLSDTIGIVGICILAFAFITFLRGKK